MREPGRLSASALAVFRLANTGGGRLLIPSICIAEIHYFSRKKAVRLSVRQIVDDLSSFEFTTLLPLDTEVLLTMEAIDDVPEMHDRIIAAHARAMKAPLVTRDAMLRRSRHIETIW